MLDTNKTYWRGIEELSQSPEFVKNSKSEFPDYIPTENENGGTYRRDFLKLMGFGVAAATLAACEAPIRKAIPYLNKPEDVDPTIPNYYASTYQDGGDYCAIVVKTREGRPIKIEGNRNSSITKGGISARVAASVLSLYDKERYRSAKIDGKPATWEALDANVIDKLRKISDAGKKINIVANTILSPSLNFALKEFTVKFPTATLITYDPNSSSGILDANEKSFGLRVLPTLDFSQSNIIVSFGADFLGTWLSPVEYAKGYAQNRKLSTSKKSMSRHYQFETIMSLSGSNADFRTAIKPSQEGLIIANLYNILASKVGSAVLSVGEIKDVKYLQKAADDLLANKGRSLVISASNDINVQLVVNSINDLLQNYGKTINIGNASYFRKGNDLEMVSLINNAKGGAVDAIIFLNCNPVYDHPMGEELKKGVAKLDVKIAISDRPNETSQLCNFIASDSHYLESWSDAMPAKDKFSLGQPTISPLFKTRQALDTILIWSGNPSSAYNYIQAYWKTNIHALSSENNFQTFWDNSLYDGIFEIGKSANSKSNFDSIVPPKVNLPAILPAFTFDVNSVSMGISNFYKANSADIEYQVYEKVGIGTGSQANNPWLQELPEPISKATWDNYLTISQKMASEKGFIQGDVVKIETKLGKNISLPILIQPGQAYNTIGIAVGYGREVAGKVANGVGKNSYPLITFKNNTLFTSGIVNSLAKTGETRELAQTQTHQTMMARPIVQESILSKYVVDPYAGRVMPKIQTSEGLKNPTDITIWDTKGLQTHTYNNHFWGLAIDLNSCIGCGSCVISCQAENNVPVVGRQEVLNRREMHWIRIDRYYSTDAQNLDDKSVVGLMDKQREEAAEDPQVVFQPVMCQHCNNAPCETVCPVLATTHSTEGLNQMTYNRCIGTRYCANNCPYKVRRFNWFSYYTNTERGFEDVNPAHEAKQNEGLGKMVLNPDVTVRARGVMEKCSMCIQRIQLGKLNAKLESRRPIDGEIDTACAQSCPTEAIVFGDMNDNQSRISKLLNVDNKERAYHLLEEINVKPSVSYLTKIRNT